MADPVTSQAADPARTSAWIRQPAFAPIEYEQAHYAALNPEPQPA
jgi:hypothetical protein